MRRLHYYYYSYAPVKVVGRRILVGAVGVVVSVLAYCAGNPVSIFGLSIKNYNGIHSLLDGAINRGPRPLYSGKKKILASLKEIAKTSPKQKCSKSSSKFCHRAALLELT